MAIPTLTMIPSGYKAGKLYSVLPTNGDGDFTTTRSSSATRVNKDGLIETMATNVPRLDYLDGNCPSLLIEDVGENLQRYSEDFTNSLWTKSSGITIDSANYASPDGGLNASKLTPTTGGTSVMLRQFSSVTSGDLYTQTFYVKSDGLRYVQVISSFNVFSNIYVNFDLQEGVVSAVGGSPSSLEYSIEKSSNGFWRIRVTSAAISTTSAGSLHLSFIKTATTARSVNEGNFNGTDSIILWGMQFETGDRATSYIPTISTTVTRSADGIVKTTLNNYIDGVEGVIYSDIKFDKLTTGSFNGLAIVEGTGSSDLISFYFSSSTEKLKLIVKQGGVTLTEQDYTIPLDSFSKIALWYKSGALKMFINGVLVSTNTTAFNKFAFEQIRSVFGGDLHMKLRDFRIYDSNLITDSFLTELTTL